MNRNKENNGGAYDLGELDQALFLYLDGQDPSSSSIQDHRQNNYGMRPPTLNIFPSQPMHIEPSSTKGEGSRKVSTSSPEQDAPKTSDPKGFHVGGNVLLGGDQGFQLINRTNISSDAAVFDLEYARWLEEHHRLICELRNAVHEEQLQEDELRIYVENCVVHYDNIMNLKGMLAKSDVFHLVSGLWKSPAERCFLWIGDFRPSEILKADNLRHQTIHRLHQILTTRQAARCFIAIGDYFHRLRALSSLWLTRPRHE
uniref:DOG1 domain-containing protein n=1 Tax=Solanum lycopersicum TaxID=4081 RepID=A0A3Q7IKQ3_SOLLC